MLFGIFSFLQEENSDNSSKQKTDTGSAKMTKANNTPNSNKKVTQIPCLHCAGFELWL